MPWKVFLWLGLGVVIGLALNSQIAGFANPILTPLKLSVSTT